MWHVAIQIAPHLAIGPDDGERYLDTVFSDGWMGQQGFGSTSPGESPCAIPASADHALDSGSPFHYWRV